MHFRNDVSHTTATSRKLTDSHLISVIQNAKIVVDALDPEHSDALFPVNVIQAKAIRSTKTQLKRKSFRNPLIAIGLLVFAIGLVSYQLCSKNVIKPTEAKDHLGKTRIVCGKLAEINYVEGLNWLNFDQAYPLNVFTALIVDENSKKFIGINRLVGKELCIKGTITTVGRSKTMIRLTESEQWIKE